MCGPFFPRLCHSASILPPSTRSPHAHATLGRLLVVAVSSAYYLPILFNHTSNKKTGGIQIEAMATPGDSINIESILAKKTHLFYYLALQQTASCRYPCALHACIMHALSRTSLFTCSLGKAGRCQTLVKSRPLTTDSTAAACLNTRQALQLAGFMAAAAAAQVSPKGPKGPKGVKGLKGLKGPKGPNYPPGGPRGVSSDCCVSPTRP